jgi:hypothetical protein
MSATRASGAAFLSQLVSRARGNADVAQPRTAGLFEPPAMLPQIASHDNDAPPASTERESATRPMFRTPPAANALDARADTHIDDRRAVAETEPSHAGRNVRATRSRHTSPFAENASRECAPDTVVAENATLRPARVASQPLPIEHEPLPNVPRRNSPDAELKRATATLEPSRVDPAPRRPLASTLPADVLNARRALVGAFHTGDIASARAEPDVHVTIGRVEIRAVSPSPAQAERKAATPRRLRLDDYLAGKERSR